MKHWKVCLGLYFVATMAAMALTVLVWTLVIRTWVEYPAQTQLFVGLWASMGFMGCLAALPFVTLAVRVLEKGKE